MNQLLLGHTKIESTVRYLGVEVGDAFPIAPKRSVIRLPSCVTVHIAATRERRSVPICLKCYSRRYINQRLDFTLAVLQFWRIIGHVVMKVGSGGAALDLLERQPNIDLVLLDFAMPGMSGVEVARQIQLRYPALPILFVTGYPDKTALGNISKEKIIQKPFIGDELAEKVDAALVRSSSLHSGAKIVVLKR